MSAKTGGPAFPQDYEHTKVLVQMQQVGDISVDQFQKLSRQLAGMTLRDYFAAKAVQGLMSRKEQGGFDFAVYEKDAMRVALWAYDLADEMLKAREQ